MKKQWGILVSTDWLSLFKLIKHTTHFVLNLLFFCMMALFGTAEACSEASWWLAGQRSSWLKKQLVTDPVWHS
jgi:hypothetical protein